MKKGIIYSLIVAMLIIVGTVVYFVGFTAGEVEGEVSANPNMEFISGEEAIEMEKCEAVNLEKKENTRIKIKIGETENIFEKSKNEKIYAIEDLDKLDYGVEIQSGNEIIYTITEVCQEEKTLSFADLSMHTMEHKNIEELGFSGNFEQFNNKQRIIRKTIKS